MNTEALDARVDPLTRLRGGTLARVHFASSFAGLVCSVAARGSARACKNTSIERMPLLKSLRCRTRQAYGMLQIARYGSLCLIRPGDYNAAGLCWQHLILPPRLGSPTFSGTRNGPHSIGCEEWSAGGLSNRLESGTAIFLG